ncbi:MAG: LysE family transporter, partial [Verrucomicrobiota bacterium]
TLGDIKAILFYASLFPFFVNLETAGTAEFIAVIAITIVSVGSVKILYAVFASRVADYARRKQLSRAPQKVAGGLLVGVGGYVAFKA